MDTISAQYPATTFALRPGVDDPEATYLLATIDVEDPDEVLDLVVDRLLTLQLDEGLPIHVLPLQTPARVVQELQHRGRRAPARALLQEADR
jgi:hypothetical protein